MKPCRAGLGLPIVPAGQGLPYGGVDRLLWAWFVVPSVMVSLASARNSHYLIHALPPLAIWSAMSLDRLADRLIARGWSDRRFHRASTALFAGLAIAWSIGFLAIGPRLNQRNAELAFYQEVGKVLPTSEPLVLLYDLERPERWDKAPYPTPFGPVPSDLAARLFYLDRRAAWRSGLAGLIASPPSQSFAVIGRERDSESLSRLGRVGPLLRGPTTRWDRAYVLYQVTFSGEQDAPLVSTR